MEIEGIKIDDTVDITDKVCPLTFVKAKVAIDELDDGEVIAIRMNDGEPVANVPRSIKDEGHQILKLVNNNDETYTLIVKKVRRRFMAERIKLSDFEEKVLNSSVPVLVDFYSDSCVPCKRLAPVVGTVEDERAESLSVYKVNINFDADAASEYEVTAAPTLVLFKDGKETARHTGVFRKDELTSWIDANI